MKLLCIVIVLLPSTWESPIKTRERETWRNRIIGGQDADEGQFPWQAAIYMDQTYFCGGSLIGKEWILTAGHCVDKYTSFTIILGTTNLSNVDTILNTEKSFLPPDYDLETVRSDIGLIRINQEVEFSDKINELILGTVFLEAGTEITISGYGVTSSDSKSLSNLQWLTMTTITNEECSNVYGEINDGIVCARTLSDTEVKNICDGDSGGPAVIQLDTDPILVGLVNFGSDQGCEDGFPAGFTRVAKFIGWIMTTIDS